MERRVYKIDAIIINRIKIEEVVIDPHIDRHSDHISDGLILELVSQLAHSDHITGDCDGDFQYFVSEIAYNHKLYKMVWLLEDSKFYVGVITAFRDRRLQ